jgi:hypothetical protein
VPARCAPSQNSMAGVLEGVAHADHGITPGVRMISEARYWESTPNR